MFLLKGFFILDVKLFLFTMDKKGLLMNKIKTFRKQKGFTMQVLAEKAGTTASQINKLEKGERRLTVEWLRRLALAFECDPRDLIEAQIDEGCEKARQAHPFGAGHQALQMLQVEHEEGEKVSNMWGVPESVFQEENISFDQLAVVKVEQSDLEPDVRRGDYVVIDCSDQNFSVPGIYIIEEQGSYVIRHCMRLQKGGGTQFKITAVSAQPQGQAARSSYIAATEDCRVKGRIVAHWHWV
jgi:transcriptional regulator with XRE-family HTH domain